MKSTQQQCLCNHEPPEDTPPILITSSIIANNKSVKLYDTELRKYHLLESIKKWASFPYRKKLVVCDGSGYDLRADINKISNSACEIEVISFVNSKDKVDKLGKGYGELEIIDYAIENSMILKENDNFAKCTGRLWVTNYPKCIPARNSLSAFRLDLNLEHLKSNKPTPIDTRFYITTKEFYLNHLSSLKDNMESGGNHSTSIEDLYADKIIALKCKHILFPIIPIICGISGASGKPYNSSPLRILKDKLKWSYFKTHPKYSALF